MAHNFKVTDRATGWYFPGEMTQPPRKALEAQQFPELSTAELEQAISVGLEWAERAANGEEQTITAPIDLASVPRGSATTAESNASK
ncbi:MULTISPECIES: hypothetical protein [Microbacterium]|uniref:hypothetical protein n=1 Tax=Microbacterium TaxID=33882 RepID=UPI0006F7A282|nr:MULTISPECIES: hypothetical protein [Microbacterium]KQR26150.1 hypothetical protein ASF76_02500 [Microbacterium sp. Leaf151]MCI9859569.1 hypothetical protein [Microbacterium proteolyticum]